MAFSFVIYVAIYFFIYISAEAILKKYVGKNGDLKFKSLTVIAFITFALVVDIVLSDVSVIPILSPNQSKSFITL